MLLCNINAEEGHDVETYDVLGAPMKADIDEILHVVMEGKLAELLVKIKPSLYSKIVVQEKGKTVIFVRLNSCLYGTLQATLMFWKDLLSMLIEWGFALNTYDCCIANKVINGKQCTIL